MSRLTCKYDVDNVLRDMCTFDRESNVEADDCLTCFEYCNNKDMNCEKCAIQKAFDKLAEYEDLEEQGLLLKLPVSLGQEVYRVNKIIIPMTVTEISYAKNFRNKPRFIIQTEEKEYRGHDYYRVENIGNTVFLTKEEAEKELKRLECAE